MDHQIYVRAAAEKKAAIAAETGRAIEAWEKEVARLSAINDGFANGRLAVFFAAVACLVMAVRAGDAPVPGFAFAASTAWFAVMLVFLAGFAALIKFHDRYVRLFDLAAAALTLKKERLVRATDPARRVSDAEKTAIAENLDHPYLRGETGFDPGGAARPVPQTTAIDLDMVAGAQNLFGLYNTAQSSPGIARFRMVLTSPLLDHAAASERQRAVSGLSGRPDLVFEAMKAIFPLRNIKFSEYIRSVGAADSIPHNLPFRAFIGAFASLPTLFVCLGLYEYAAYGYLFNAMLIGAFFERCSVVKKNYSCLWRFGSAFAGLSRLFSSERFDTAILSRLASVFTGGPRAGSPSAFASTLEKISGIAYVLSIPVPVILDACFLFDLNMCERIERRVSGHRAELLELVAGLAEFEALSSFANIIIDNPEYSFPVILPGGAAVVSFDHLAHPFIPFDKVVANSVALDDSTSIMIVTGSNMSGKSTFLKSIALSIVVACAGGPVRAMSASLSPVWPVTDIRVSDSITLGVSYFYSELLRVKAVTDELAKSGMVLGIFDELFHGTNSRERIALCRATLAFLAKGPGKYIIATHDRELTSLAEQSGMAKVRNYHFEEKVAGADSVFTYRLLPGPADHTNAILLARRCGLPDEICEAAEAFVK